MGKARTLRSPRMGATANMIAEQPDDSDRIASAFASLIAATAVAGTQVPPSTTPNPSYPNRTCAGPWSIRSVTKGSRSVSLRVFSTAMAETHWAAGRPMNGMDELLLQRLAALESRIKGLEAQVEPPPRAADAARGPIVRFSGVAFNHDDDASA